MTEMFLTKHGEREREIELCWCTSYEGRALGGILFLGNIWRRLNVKNASKHSSWEKQGSKMESKWYRVCVPRSKKPNSNTALPTACNRTFLSQVFLIFCLPQSYCLAQNLVHCRQTTQIVARSIFAISTQTKLKWNFRIVTFWMSHL